MKNLIISSAIIIIIAIVICGLLSFTVTTFAPHISNDVAIGQLENDDISWSIMQSWNRLLNVVELIQAAIWAVCLGSVGINTYKYFNNKKEN